MARIYSLTQLRKIHAEKSASNGVLYQTEDTRVDGIRYFLGDSEGRLEEITDVTLIEGNTTNITSNDVDIAALQAEDARLEAVKADKCYAIAMSIIL
jgi:hypothetical protein